MTPSTRLRTKRYIKSLSLLEKNSKLPQNKRKKYVRFPQLTNNQKMSAEVFSPIVGEKIPEKLKVNSVFGPFQEKYKSKECVYFGGFRHGLKFGWGKMVLGDQSYIEGVFNGDDLGKWP